MKDHLSIAQQVLSTITSYIPKGERVIVGYSGGPDSEALVELLSSLDGAGYEIHLAHVDHGWREESSREALLLAEKTKKRGFSFHLCSLQGKTVEGNLENWAREERQAFFEALGKKIGSTWLLLGHQKDDSIEVSFKRLMEGAHLVQARGIDLYSVRGSLHILRPLLSFKKSELLEYLRWKGATWIEDSTNQDMTFVRSSLRHELFPALERTFRKNVRRSLEHVAYESALLEEHVQEALQDQFVGTTTGSIAHYRKKKPSCSLFLGIQAIHQAAQSFGGHFHREQEQKAAEIMAHDGKSAVFSARGLTMYVDKSGFLLVKGGPLLPLPKESLVTEAREHQIGSWLLDATIKPPYRVVPGTYANLRTFLRVALNKEWILSLPAPARKNAPLLLAAA